MNLRIAVVVLSLRSAGLIGPDEAGFDRNRAAIERGRCRSSTQRVARQPPGVRGTLHRSEGAHLRPVWEWHVLGRCLDAPGSGVEGVGRRCRSEAGSSDCVNDPLPSLEQFQACNSSPIIHTFVAVLGSLALGIGSYGCSVKKQAFLQALVCVKDDADLVAFIREMRTIAQSENAKFIDNSSNTARELSMRR